MPPKKGVSPLSSVLQSLVPDRSKRLATEASAVRVAIRENFVDIADARDRGVSWQQIVTALTGAGVRDDGGGPITVNGLRSLFHAERYSQGQRRKRRTKKPAQATVANVAQVATGQTRLNAFANRPVEPKPEPPQSVSRPGTTPYRRKTTGKSIWEDDG